MDSSKVTRISGAEPGKGQFRPSPVLCPPRGHLSPGRSRSRRPAPSRPLHSHVGKKLKALEDLRPATIWLSLK